MKKTPEGAERGADPVPRALTTISVLLTIGTAGAALGGLLLATVQAAVPAVPLVTLAGAMIAGRAGSAPLGRTASRRTAGPR